MDIEGGLLTCAALITVAVAEEEVTEKQIISNAVDLRMPVFISLLLK
jgi:hypothetical protein